MQFRKLEGRLSIIQELKTDRAAHQPTALDSKRREALLLGL